ncbi:MAG: DUF547 domain-containing protein [Mariniblastus sp.]|nr:DUF547 domain-containing protein [Mariniblastus sp.]
MRRGFPLNRDTRLLGLFLLVIGLLFVVSTSHADEQAGRKWPAPQRVSYDRIDHSLFNDLLRKYVDQNGLVNYAAWHVSNNDRKLLQSYLAELGKADVHQPSTKQSEIAYWINAYNALTLEGILRVYPTTSIRNHTSKIFGYNIWKNLKLMSGDQWVSLDHIEHQILRKQSEPRIHFAIVCAAVGCPRLLNEAYAGTKLEQQLKANSQDFFSRQQNLRIDEKKKAIYLSQILSWFGADFGETQIDQLESIVPYFPKNVQQRVREGGYRIEFSNYDWSLNSQK